MSQPLVTIIVPCHNVATYLDRCVSSIVAQDWQNLEVLLVDDGSTDTSGDICDSWAARDQRISVIHKPYGGVSDARNAALAVASGQYISFIDSDDCVAPTLVSALHQVITATGADIAICSHTTFSGMAAPPHTHNQSGGKVTVMSPDEAILNVFYQHKLTHSPWGRLFKAHLWQTLRFPTGIIYEDLAVIYPLFRQAKKIAVTDQRLYNYFIRPDSILGHFTPRRLDVLRVLENLLPQVEPKYRKAVQSRLLSASFNMLGLMPHDMPGYAEASQHCWTNIVNLRATCFFNRRVRLKNKLGIIISLLGKRLLTAVLSALLPPSRH